MSEEDYEGQERIISYGVTLLKNNPELYSKVKRLSKLLFSKEISPEKYMELLLHQEGNVK